RRRSRLHLDRRPDQARARDRPVAEAGAGAGLTHRAPCLLRERLQPRPLWPDTAQAGLPFAAEAAPTGNTGGTQAGRRRAQSETAALRRPSANTMARGAPTSRSDA